MKQILNHFKTFNQAERRVYITGLVFVIFSLIIYLLFSNVVRDFNLFTMTFFVNFILCIAYLVIMGIYKQQMPKPRGAINQGIWINAIILFTISAFSLNGSLNVFATFPFWLNIYTIISCMTFLTFPFINHIPPLVRPILFFLAGASLILALYMCIYLLPLIPLSTIAFWFFGLSLHTFVPFVWMALLVNFLFIRNQGYQNIWAISGMILPLFVLVIYLHQWKQIQMIIGDVLAEKNINASQTLPDDIVLAQKLPSDALSEQIIVSPFKSQFFWDDGFGLGSMGQEKFHDPLSVIAIQLYGKPDLDYRTAETVLNIRRDYRHKTSRRLWTGTSLSTGSVSTNIEVYPDFRFAYHEKTITIHNDPSKKDRDAWFTLSTQEAIYTFHLPEGSIVTSLSLWINGKEEKSRLTTKHKADSAYTTIVGVERRDPALVHWQEGNRITVTVFPCTPEENRTFKIGFTTPLTESNNKLWLENIWFEGPETNQTREVTQVSFMGGVAKASEIPEDFEMGATNKYIYKGAYNPYWKMGFEKVTLSKEGFSFNGNSYTVHELTQQSRSVYYEEIYLDVMKEWSKEEYETLINSLPGKELYVWLPEKTRITSENREKIWKDLSRNQYSLPFLYDIKNPKTSIVITKSGHRSPLLSDLKGSEYAQRTTEYFKNSLDKVKLLDFGEELSPFWKSLHELRMVEYTKADLSGAIQIIHKNQFSIYEEDNDRISIVNSKMSILKQPFADSGKVGKAPDHLLRLFAYNDVMRKVGKNYFKSKDYEQEIFSEAEEGYIVTPVTSMIVLESEADYKRMGIDENKNTIGNAGILGGGAVPEPHEWALIAIVVALVILRMYKKYKEKITNLFRC